MKYKTTAKAIKDGYYYIISVGYCDLQNLLNYEKPVAYASGLYGWRFDIYEVDGNVAICTGYQPVGAQHTKKDYALIREYENKAKGKTREEKSLLLKEFVEKMLIIE